MPQSSPLHSDHSLQGSASSKTEKSAKSVCEADTTLWLPTSIFSTFFPLDTPGSSVSEKNNDEVTHDIV